jgi:hypothetical protein
MVKLNAKPQGGMEFDPRFLSISVSSAVIRSVWKAGMLPRTPTATHERRISMPLLYIRLGVAASLVGLGVYKLIRSRCFRWGGMQVGFSELTI